MKIRSIEFENFRNFKEHGKIDCSYDGKFTIIYGKNGSGKTTLHQLFQWVLYGITKFNKTATDKLYNFEYEKEQAYNSRFEVWGKIDFEDNKKMYSVTRKYFYKKGLTSQSSVKVGESFSLQYMDSEYNWVTLDNPREIIEKILPSGLSDYFFFDGESMIADLQIKGKDSADKLKKSLYNLFNLDIYKSAYDRLGNESAKTTVIGNVFLSKVNDASDEKTQAIKREYMDYQDKQERLEKRIAGLESDQKTIKNTINEISEKIGTTKSREQYNSERDALKINRDRCLDNAKKEIYLFGEKAEIVYPRTLISKTVDSALSVINMQIEKDKLPKGLTRELVDFILEEGTCICGNSLSEKEKAIIESYRKKMPPYSYKSVYQNFKERAKYLGSNYDVNEFDEIITNVSTYLDDARKNDREIQELDEKVKNVDRAIEELIIERGKQEEAFNSVSQKLIAENTDKKLVDAAVIKRLNELKAATKHNAINERVDRKLRILQSVKDHFGRVLEEKSDKYSSKLETTIQELMDAMLTSERTVRVSKDFMVRIIDNYNDESKSEGQFAVVSFAYIGGILKMMKNEKSLSNKDYPLVLDGPFSKLDKEQKQNVINELPGFAPQVIVFSKDDLSDSITENMIGRVYTIMTNVEKNVAKVEEGFLWK